MSKLHFFEDGGYFFLEGGFPYLQGLIAAPGYSFHRIRFSKPLPMKQRVHYKEVRK